MDDQKPQQWIVVTKTKNIRKSRRNNKNTNQLVWQKGAPVYHPGSEQNHIHQFKISQSYIANANLIQSQLQQLLKLHPNCHSIHIECLGIGDFLKYFKPRYQFYFLKYLLVGLCEKLTGIPPTVNIYDPVFTEQCQKEIQKLGTNYEYKGSNSQNNNKVKVFFMPHCQKFLYELVCSKQNKAFLMIGNSLKQYMERAKMLSQQYPQIFDKKAGLQKPLQDFQQSLNDSFVYIIPECFVYYNQIL